ncbi:MAG: glycine zipper 2TM domain-containing protein [Sterolibacteriaceae bacterium]|uniref:Glycine zipper 2TM domain-containing protein n=1 Tax=Candidatus Methylophosphatis roskildensis TaxID=2899263 RepID=A0A9D7E471_9PROT|nr:glycine zipper 2TM domain-containing protein [Candidatus Methylophosphatis roskildensis]MBK7236581.1 glycine zipper 2TM domain-containing protein [Sterolibacteriaceae bacterium]
MQAIQNQPPRKLHPVMWVAAVSVIVFSLVGIGAVTGLIPTSNSQPAADKQATPLVPPQLATMPRAPAEQPAAAAPAVIEEYDQLSPAAAPKPAPLSQPITPPATRSAESTPVPRKAAKPEPMRAAQAPIENRAPAMPAAEPAPAPARVVCNQCGVVSSVRTIERKGEGSGVGAVGGAVAGGVIGHQMGGGRGRDVMTVVGAIAGGLGGHEVEKRVRKVVKHQVTVRFDDGTTRTFTYDRQPMFRNGDQVRLSNGALVIDNR